MRMAKSSDDIEDHLPSDTATLEPAGVLLLEKSRHGGGNEHNQRSTDPLTVISGQEPPKPTEMMGHEHIFPGFTVPRMSAYLLRRTTHMLCISCVHARLCWWFELAGVWRHPEIWCTVTCHKVYFFYSVILPKEDWAQNEMLKMLIMQFGVLSPSHSVTEPPWELWSDQKSLMLVATQKHCAKIVLVM